MHELLLKMEQYWIQCLCVHSSYITSLFYQKKLAPPIAAIFHVSFQIVACYTFGKLEIRTLTPNKFRN